MKTVPRLSFAGDIADIQHIQGWCTSVFEVPKEKRRVWKEYVSHYWVLKQNLCRQNNLWSLKARTHCRIFHAVTCFFCWMAQRLTSHRPLCWPKRRVISGAVVRSTVLNAGQERLRFSHMIGCCLDFDWLSQYVTLGDQLIHQSFSWQLLLHYLLLNY